MGPVASDAQLTVHFDLGTQEGRDAMDLFLSGPELLRAVREIDQWLRNQVKYTDQPEPVLEAYQRVREKLRDAIPSRLQEAL
jgi:hypothetical protein